MSRIAHLTDLHVLEEQHRSRGGLGRLRLAFLSAGRPLDAAARRARVLRALELARRSAADHVVITGDLTEDGTASQFETLAELLAQSGIAPSKTTLIPGNHDGYDHAGAWRSALDGPLRDYARTSADGAVCELSDAWVVAVPTPLDQHYARSAGRLEPRQAEAIARLARDSALCGKTLLIAQHHPPLKRRWSSVQWWDGLVGFERMIELLRGHAHAHVLHGHVHRSWDAALAGRSHRQIFSAAAVVDHADPVRLYEVADGGVLPVLDARRQPGAAALARARPALVMAAASGSFQL